MQASAMCVCLLTGVTLVIGSSLGKVYIVIVFDWELPTANPRRQPPFGTRLDPIEPIQPIQVNEPDTELSHITPFKSYRMPLIPYPSLWSSSWFGHVSVRVRTLVCVTVFFDRLNVPSSTCLCQLQPQHRRSQSFPSTVIPQDQEPSSCEHVFRGLYTIHISQLPLQQKPQFHCCLLLANN